MIDVSTRIAAVDRTVGDRTIEAGQSRTVTLATTYPATVEDVWEAVTDPERLPRWFAPVSGELRLGGRYQVENNAGGTIESCEPPHRFSATWEFGGGMSWIELTVDPQGADRTRLTLEHIAPEDEHWKTFGPGAVGIGWDLALMGLNLHLTTGGGRGEFDEDAWGASPEGLEFVRRSGDGWYAADVAGGTEEPIARERADRTIAFFSGAEVPDD
ncbi:SRPBCC family protein [Georgenia deserti]|uniref:SRPBCC family protein n=1 Tax=Georgenia deserti TaxID=2093781 RepID=A0ABW4L558_9MICO